MFPPLEYPWDVATMPFVVRAEGVSVGEAARPSPDAVAIVASGSNASPTRLLQKLAPHLDGHAVSGMPCVVDGWTPVYSAHFTFYGALPATLDREPGARAELICLHVPAALLPVVHRSEALGRNYGCHRLEDGAVRDAEGAVIAAPHTYLSLYGVLELDGAPRRLTAFAVEGSARDAADERTVLDAVRRLLAPDVALDAFIARLVDDGAFRTATTARLSARPIDTRGLRAIA